MKRRRLSARKSRKVFRRGSKVHRKNSLNSTAGGIMRGGIRF
jgi:hypothetical protein